jgi:signal transduction histidine kinase
MAFSERHKNFRYAAIFVLLFTSTNLRANNIIDSLEKKLTILKDSSLVDMYCELCWQYRFTSGKKAIEYGNKAIDLAKQINYKKGLAQAYNDQGIIFYDLQEYEKCLANYKEALRIRKQLNDSIGIAALYNKLGITYQRKADWVNSLKYQQLALSLYEKLNMKKEQALVLSNIGIIHYDTRNYNEALKWYDKSVAICKEINFTTSLTRSYLNIGNVYYIQKKYNKAEEYFILAEKQSRENNDIEALSIILNNIGALYKEIEKNDKAILYLTEAFQIREKLNDRRGMIATLVNIASVYTYLNKYNEALLKLKQAETLSKQIDAKTELPGLYSNLSLVYENLGKFKEALEAQKLLTLYRDSLVNENLVEKVSEMNTKYETEKKEKENLKLHSENKIKDLKLQQEQKQRKTIFLFSGAGFIFLIVFFTLLISRNNIKKKAEMELKLSEQQALRFKEVIEAEEKERKRIAQELHDGLGQLLSSAKLNVSSLEDDIEKEDEEIYNNAINLIDEAVHEVRSISHNLMPASLMRYGLIKAIEEQIRKINLTNKVEINFVSNTINNRINESKEIALYRIVQEVLNNMLKHSQASIINVTLNQNQNEGKLIITDNGKGFDTKQIEQSKGIGWKNIYSRCSIIDAKINVHSEKNKGTKIEITYTI